MNIAVCTLFEGSYHIGAAALANSLHAGGFRGRFFAGYRGAIPSWAAKAQNIDFVPLETAEHLTNHKPAFITRVFEQLAPDADAVVYLDPDIVVKCGWDAVFPAWLADGIALVEDINANMPARHPRRLAWLRWLDGENGARHDSRSLERYYNAGFIGVPRAHIGFLSLWQRIVALSQKKGGAGATLLKNGDANSLFHSADQDALNFALMLATDIPINAAGPEAMDFTPGGHQLSHATGTPKPWQRGHLARALHGYPPSQAVKNFQHYTASPIAVFPPFKRFRQRLALGAAAFVGRFYRRA